jgi:hypothetical protein
MSGLARSALPNPVPRGCLINGDLATFPIVPVLQFLAASAVTGTFWTWANRRGVYISFEEGKIVAILESDVDLESEDLEDELLHRASRAVARLMTWPEGQFGFSYLPAGPEKSGRPRVEVEKVLLRAAWELDEGQRT